MAGAAPTAKCAPFLRPLDLLDRGLLLAESSLSFVTVGLMLFAAVSDSALGVMNNWSGGARILACTLLWVVLVTLKLTGSSEGKAPAEWLMRTLFKREMPRTEAVRTAAIGFVPVAVLLGWLTLRAMVAIRPSANDVLMQGTLWAAFLGASFATRNRRHLAIDAVSRLLPDRGRRLVVAVSASMGAFIALTLARGIYLSLIEAAQTADQSLREMRASGASSGTVNRDFEFQFVIPGGFLMIGIRLLLHSFHEFVASFAGPAPAPEKAKEAPGSAAGDTTDGLVPVEVPTPSTEEVKAPPFIDQATAIEVAIGTAALFALLIGTHGTTVFRPMVLVSALAALTMCVPLALRHYRCGNLTPPHPEPAIPVRGTALHFVLAVVGVVAIVGAMFALAQRIESIPVTVGVAFFAVMALLGAPLFSFLGGMGLFLFVKYFLSQSGLAHDHAFVNSFEDILGNHFARMSVLATIPLFTLAGYIMSESRMPQRLVRVSRALLGWMPGGLAVVCVFASAFFTIFSGASGITIVAVGGLLVPALLRDKYPEGFSLGLVTTGGALGITVPPCLPLIVYGIVAGLQEPAPGQERLELQKFLLSGLFPGVIAIGLVVLYAIVIGAISKVPRSRFDAREAAAALWEAKWELVLPVILLVGLAKGIFNPSQAAAFTAFYVFVMEVFIYRDLSIRHDLPRIVPESMVLVGAIFVKLCAATVLVGYFVQAQTADKLFEWLTCGAPAQAFMHAHAGSIGTCREAVDALARSHQNAGGFVNSDLSFMIGLNFFLLIVGMLMDIFSAIVVIVPLISGIALHFNINPYHLGIVFLVNLEIGYLMPPMGLNLFIAGFRFNRPVPDLYKMVLPFIGVFIVAMMITTYVPLRTRFTLGMFHRAEVTQTVGAHSPTDGSAATDADGGAGAALPVSDCDTPGVDEAPEQFERRCHVDFDLDGLIAGQPIDAGATHSTDASAASNASDASVAGDASANSGGG